MSKEVIEGGKLLFELRALKQELEDKLKIVNKQKTLLEEHTLPTLMADAEIEKVTIEGHGTLSTQSKVRAYILVDDIFEAHQWFKDNGHGSLIKESVHHATLKAWCKERMEDGQDVPEILHAKPYTIARIRSTNSG